MEATCKYALAGGTCDAVFRSIQGVASLHVSSVECRRRTQACA